jgi:hypothetical protein
VLSLDLILRKGFIEYRLLLFWSNYELRILLCFYFRIDSEIFSISSLIKSFSSKSSLERFLRPLELEETEDILSEAFYCNSFSCSYFEVESASKAISSSLSEFNLSFYPSRLFCEEKLKKFYY